MTKFYRNCNNDNIYFILTYRKISTTISRPLLKHYKAQTKKWQNVFQYKIYRSKEQFNSS